jgi:hypothetical protein
VRRGSLELVHGRKGLASFQPLCIGDNALLDLLPYHSHLHIMSNHECGFRRNPAGYSDLMPAGIPI